MFLKRMELLGFKSFADKTEIVFNKGITALLGPNGCGKSNIVDSIKWVLGEQSTRNMRAEKMEDVIFNGTEGRKALNVAEVTLFMSNEENLLDLDVPEVAVKRRLYRSGESEYLVNNTPVRLKELRELFLDTGVGKSAYSIMEQGRIDQILSSKPEERRYIFEEAAGITKFKMKGYEAERKLKKTEENMHQVENILHEVKRSYDALKKQTEKTMVYRELKEKIFQLDLDLKLLQLKKFLESGEKKKTRLADLEKKFSQYGQEEEELVRLLKESAGQVDSMESELIESQKRLYGIDLEKDNRNNEIRLIKERRGETEGAMEKTRLQEKGLTEKVRLLVQAAEEKGKEKQNYLDRIGEIENSILQLGKKISQAEETIKSNEEASRESEKALEEGEKARTALEAEIRDLTDSIVSELDRGLRDSRFSLKRKEELELNLSEWVASYRIQIEGKAAILKDFTSLAGEKSSDLHKSNLIFLQESQVKLDQLEDMLDSYKANFPSFITELVSPEGIISRKKEIEEALNKRLIELKSHKDMNRRRSEENRELAGRIEEFKKNMEELRITRARMTTQVTACEDSLKNLEKEKGEQEVLLQQNREKLAEEQKKIGQFDGEIKKIEEAKAELDKEKEALRKSLAQLETGISSRNKELSGKQQALREKQEKINKTNVDIEKIRLELTHVDEEIEMLSGDFRDRNSRELTEFEDRIPEIKRESREIREDLSGQKQKMRQLGQVNLMAPEEFAEVKERYDFLNGQLDDLRKAKEDLIQVTGEIRKESAELFIKTYREVEENFKVIFRRLFGGGRAEFKLIDPDNVLESGIEMYAQPPGKKLENISLLSGGERSMTGVALLFATYMVRPSPFCILDEIDAALDDANIQRFVNVLVDFADRSQFIVITHNKKTVTGAKTLLGVTMQESGVSRLVAMRLDKEESDG
ncbi:MAG: AAA family ATPase [Spirochaetales bacterium]|nr:AAA family ATPase [Spirochaetales bacterium]